MAIVAGAVALSAAAWVVTDAAWDEDPSRQVIVERDAWTRTHGPSGYVWTTAPPCTPPPGMRDGRYSCVRRVPPP